MKNLYVRVLCILTPVVLLLFTSLTSDARSGSLVKLVRKSGAGHLTPLIKEENNQPLHGVSFSIEKERWNTSAPFSGNYVFVLAPGTYAVLISAVNFSSQKISGIINPAASLIYHLFQLKLLNLNST